MGNRGYIRIKSDYNIAVNKDFQATELFLKQYKTFDYNSFIFGSSRAFYYNIKTWEKYIDGNCFHFSSSAESLFGIHGKLKFLDERNVKIKNALIILDYWLLTKTNNSNGHLAIKHPLISGESFPYFYAEMFRGFFPKAMIAHTELFLTGKRKPYMDKYGVRENVWKLDLNSNQLTNHRYDSIIENHFDAYYKDKGDLFYQRDSVQQYSVAAIGENQKELLLSMQSILSSKKTNFKIIISPLYNQLKINREDLNYLNELFGEGNVFDFSGINKYTESKYNYYETDHYRPHVASELMKEAYN